jgi:hypothetical protein
MKERSSQKFRDAAGSMAARTTAAKERNLISASGRRTAEGASEIYKVAALSCFVLSCSLQRATYRPYVNGRL